MTSTNHLTKACEIMDTAIEWTVSVIVAVMVINISMGIFCRYVLQNALFWTEEMSRYLMVWAGMLGAALALKDDSHIGVTFVLNRFPPPAKRVAQLAARLIVAAFLAILFFKSFDYLKTLSIQKSAAMELPMTIPYLSVTVGAFLMFIENLVLMVRLFMKSENPEDGKREGICL